AEMSDRRIAPWPTEELARVGDEIAIATSRLISTERQWIHRRVEKFEFYDATRVRRAMSIDFTLPEAYPPAGSNPDAFIVPLALPTKEPLRDLDITCSAGENLPLLTRDENSALASAMLRLLSEEVLIASGRFDRIEDEVAFDLADIVGARYGRDDRPSDRMRLRRVEQAVALFRKAASAPAPPRVTDQQRLLLWTNRAIRPLIDLLRDRFIFFVRMHSTPGDRRVVK